MAPEDPILVVPYDARWPEEFREIGRKVRAALGPIAARIDHVGSTAVPGLDAKPVIDVQISVPDLRNETSFRLPMESLGFVYHPDNPDRSKRYFREPPGMRRTHVHVRRVGSFDEQLNLLLRGYLRTHEDACREYAQAKLELAARFRDDRDGYVRAKEPTIWSLLQRAHDWLEETGWEAPVSDA
jgi:GrpB-like predicted nucleotidyltransferase (UPF0157 family)